MANKIMIATPGNMTGMLNNATMQKTISSLITDPNKRDALASSMLSMIQQTPALQQCEVGSVMNAAIAGASLDLPYNFGYWYAVPYNNKNKNCKEAQFQIGAKGLKQLALRTGEYEKIITNAIKEGELTSYNPITEEFTFNPIMDIAKREKTATIGYYAMFKLKNGYIKEIYWPIEKMEIHANQYSQAFKLYKYRDLMAGKVKEKDMWSYSSFWYKNFDEMAEKTMLKQLIGKDGMLSVQMQRASQLDQSTVHISNHDTLIPAYVDTKKDEPVEPVKEVQGDGPTDENKVEKKVDMFSGFDK